MNNQTFCGSKWLDTLKKLTIRKTAKYTEILKTTEEWLEFLKIYLTFHKYQRKINASVWISYKHKEELLGRTPSDVPWYSFLPDTAFARAELLSLQQLYQWLQLFSWMKSQHWYIMDVTAYSSFNIKNLQKS